MTKNHTRYFTEEEAQDLVYEHEIDREEYEDRRWSRTVYSVVKADDGKLYGIVWELGLTEYQENMFDDGDYEEVFETVVFKASRKVSYLTTEEMQKKSNNIDEEIASLRLVGDEDKVNTALSPERHGEIEAALELFGKLEGLDPVANFEAVRKVTIDYLKTIQKEIS